MHALMLLAAAFVLAEEAEIPKTNPHTTAADVERGRRLFAGHCAGCHGPAGEGARGPNLARPTLPRAADDAALFRLIRDGIEGTEMPGAWVMIDREIWQVAAYIRGLGRASAETLPGDPARGANLFRAKCQTCHMVGYEGGRMGPPLTEVGNRRSSAYLRSKLFDPGANVSEGYVYVRAVARDGRRIEGIRLNEDTYSIQLRDLSDNLHSILKSELVDLAKERNRSPMPSYKGALLANEVDDLVAYLTSLRGGQ